MRTTFGPFTFDTATRELRRGREVVRLQAQPAQVLAVLIEHAGDVVTREALRQAVWGDDTFVDFDKGLNFAIAQVRNALGDSAETPIYIRTFPKRGYQFVAASEVTPGLEVAQGFSPAEPRSPKGLRHNRLVKGALAATIVVLAAIVAGWLWSSRRPAHVIGTIAVTPFDNQTGLADYDRYAQNVTDALVAELTTSGAGRYAVIGNAAVLRVPRARRDIVAIGETLNAGYIVLGQVQREGSRVRVLAHLIRLPEQKHLWVTRVESDPQDPSTAPSGLAHRITTEFLDKI